MTPAAETSPAGDEEEVAEEPIAVDRPTPPATSAAAGVVVRDRVHVVTTEKPPPSPTVVKTQEFVEVEDQAHRRATEWAIAELAKKYPGQSTTLETLQSLINQHLAACGKLPT